MKKKKYRLKRKVKETLIIIAAFVGLILSLVALAKISEKGMEDCTKAGHSIQFCQRHL